MYCKMVWIYKAEISRYLLFGILLQFSLDFPNKCHEIVEVSENKTNVDIFHFKYYYETFGYCSLLNICQSINSVYKVHSNSAQ
jgi:hypothetical protein